MKLVYIDMLILLNFVANYLLLLGAGRVAAVPLRRWRIACGALLGALYAAGMFLPNAEWLALWQYKLLCGVAMVLITYGGERNLLKISCIFFTASAGLAGVILAAELLGGAGVVLGNGVVYSDFDVRLLLLIFVACYFVLSVVFRRSGRHNAREFVKLQITTNSGKVELTALLDSGHTLTDPVTNQPVIIADYSFFRNDLPKGTDPTCPVESLKRCRANGISNVRLIPYRAVGVECGMLLALRAKSVVVNERDLGSLLIALSPTLVSDGGSYQALIGGI